MIISRAVVSTFFMTIGLGAVMKELYFPSCVVVPKEDVMEGVANDNEEAGSISKEEHSALSGKSYHVKCIIISC
jgi:hypothetical protein